MFPSTAHNYDNPLLACRFGDTPQVVPPGFEDVALTALAWNCPCRGKCSVLDAAQCLHRATLDVLSTSEEEAGDSVGVQLLRPLTTVVSQQRCREGQDECSRYAEALADGDATAALLSSGRLLEMAQAFG